MSGVHQPQCQVSRPSSSSALATLRSWLCFSFHCRLDLVSICVTYVGVGWHTELLDEIGEGGDGWIIMLEAALWSHGCDLFWFRCGSALIMHWRNNLLFTLLNGILRRLFCGLCWWQGEQRVVELTRLLFCLDDYRWKRRANKQTGLFWCKWKEGTSIDILRKARKVRPWIWQSEIKEASNLLPVCQNDLLLFMSLATLYVYVIVPYLVRKRSIPPV